MTKAACHLFCALIAVAALASAGYPASAQTTTDFSNGTATFSSSLNSGGIHTGQTFTVPANVTHITAVSLGVSSVGGSPNYSLELYRISGGAVDALIQTSNQSIDAGTTIPSYEVDTLTLAGAGIPVTAGDKFLISGFTPTDVQAFLALRDSDAYSGGAYYNGYFEVASAETFFRVEYTDAIMPAAVPTMTEWAMILFGLMLSGGAALIIQMRRFSP